MRTVLFMFCAAMLYMMIGITLGVKFTIIFSAVLLLLMAVFFLVKEKYYIEFNKLINPSFLKTSEEKSLKINKLNRVVNICYLGIMGGIFILEGVLMPDASRGFLFLPAQMVVFTSFLFTIFTVIFLLSSFVYKKIKTSKQFIGYSVAKGIFAVLIINFVTTIVAQTIISDVIGY